MSPVTTIIILLGLMGLLQEMSQAQTSSIDSALVDRESYTSVNEFIKQGKFDLHARSFWMSTCNKGVLTDYSAWAFGAGIGYKTPRLKGFSLGMSGYFIFKLHDKNLKGSDPLSGGSNRYELPLFDMGNPDNREDLDRLEELYMEYRYRNAKIAFGRQHIETPFLNGQDNRMRPNLFSGIWSETQAGNLLLRGGWIRRVSPRGTVNWFDVQESMGVYPFGNNVDGNPSEYKGNVTTGGIFIVGSVYQQDGVKMNVYNYFTENIFNLLYADISKEIIVGDHLKIDLGVQSFWQMQIGEGGHEDPSKKYIHNDEKTFGVGNKVVLEFRNHTLSANTLYIHDSGRFLFPREWGREQFWASLPRERFEGNGGLRSISFQWRMLGYEDRFESLLGIGFTETQDPSLARLNKNSMPSWTHVVGKMIWHFDHTLDGVSIGVIVVHKGKLGSRKLPPQWTINRVDLIHYNLIIDYKF